ERARAGLAIAPRWIADRHQGERPRRSSVRPVLEAHFERPLRARPESTKDPELQRKQTRCARAPPGRHAALAAVQAKPLNPASPRLGATMNRRDQKRSNRPRDVQER